jgi:hypothetical protein
MDSDIRAKGDFVSELIPYLGQCAGVFSGSPIGATDQDRILPKTCPWMPGRFSRSDSGVCLGSTYVAMYDNRVLQQAIDTTGVGFEHEHWKSMPVQYRDWLAEMGLQKTGYDAGKLLNLVLTAQGEQIAFVESSGLVHIGGISVRTVREKYGFPQKVSKVRARVRKVRRRLERVLDAWGIGTPRARYAATADVRALNASWRKRHSAASGYFVELLSCLFDNQQRPAVPDVGDPAVEERMRLATADIVALYNEFADQLVR